MYEIEFYHIPGQHSAGERNNQFRYLVRQAAKQRKADVMQQEYAEAEYIGVDPVEGKLRFAIIHCTMHYYNRIKSIDCFKDQRNKKIFLDACLRYIETGRIQIGKYI